MDKKTHEATLRKILRPGDTITHTRCMGCLEEHIYTGNDGQCLCGRPTRDTIRLGGPNREVNDIVPGNVTHINRIPVEVCEFAVEFQDRVAPNQGAASSTADQLDANLNPHISLHVKQLH